ncbi:MAG TPA: hypothetical protein PKM43_23310 [Verrucomicrobiota bacterium]|nr:hypothetical protein [Verrucomicrobiota bacterium]
MFWSDPDSEQAVNNARTLWKIVVEMERVSRRILFETLPDTRRRKRLSKKVLGLIEAPFGSDPIAFPFGNLARMVGLDSPFSFRFKGCFQTGVKYPAHRFRSGKRIMIWIAQSEKDTDSAGLEELCPGAAPRSAMPEKASANERPDRVRFPADSRWCRCPFTGQLL